MVVRLSTFVFILVQCHFLWSAQGGLQKPKIDVGVSGVVPNVTLYGGVVVSDKKSIIASLYSPIEGHAHVERNKSHVDEVLEIRRENIKNLAAVMPFELLKWPVINTKPCPNYQHTGHNRLERGQGMSHMQMWLEFVFFDVDVLDARVRKVPEYITSNDYSSVSGIFQSVENGSLYKNNIPFLDEDIMLVLEDSAVLMSDILPAGGGTHNNETKKLVRTYLGKALSGINVDVLSLGVTQAASRQLSEVDPAVEIPDAPGEKAEPAEEQLPSAHKNHSSHSKHNTYTAHNTHNTHNTHTPHATTAHKPVHANTHNAHAALHTTTDTITPYAYALTRAGAKKLIACYDHCGLHIHEQILACVEGELVRHAHAVYPLFARSE